MSIVITGAAGFIGSNLVNELNNLGQTDLILVDFYNAFAKTWTYSLKKQKYNQIIEPNDFLNNYSKFNINQIYHIGAISDTQVSDTSLYFKYNYDYTISLISLFKKYSLNNNDSIFVNASSSAVYGNNNTGPLNAYALSKKMIDDYIISNYDNLDKKIISFRFFNTYGPNEYHKDKMSSMIYQLYNEYNSNKTFTIFEYGEQIRDHIYVKDLIFNILNYVKLKNYKYPVLDLGTGHPVSFNELLNTIKLVIQDFEVLHAPIKFIPMPDRIRKVYQTYTKAKFKSDWNPIINYDLKTGITDYYNILSACGLNGLRQEISTL